MVQRTRVYLFKGTSLPQINGISTARDTIVCTTKDLPTIRILIRDKNSLIRGRYHFLLDGFHLFRWVRKKKKILRAMHCRFAFLCSRPIFGRKLFLLSRHIHEYGILVDKIGGTRTRCEISAVLLHFFQPYAFEVTETVYLAEELNLKIF